MKFIGGVLDGQEHDVWAKEELRVSVKDGKWHRYPDRVVKEWQVYIRKGDTYEYSETKTHS
jgi:hypothetical protein